MWISCLQVNGKFREDIMAITLFSIKPLLETLFKILNKSTNYFADAYLLKNVSLVSKWKTGKVIPKNEDISKLVEFVNNESTGMQRHLIRNKLEEFINESSLDVSLKNMLLGIEDFSLFLTEVLILSISDTDEKGVSGTLVDNDMAEELSHHEEVKLLDVLSNSHGIQGFFKVFSKNLHKVKTKKNIFLVIALCVTVLFIQQFIGIKDSSSTIYINNFRSTGEPNTIQLSDKYFMSYTYMSDSVDKVQVDINNIPITSGSAPPLVIDNVLYLPFGDVLMNMGFSFISFNGSTKICKEIRTGKTVIAKVGSKELQINDEIVKLSDSIRMGKYDVYIPAYSLKYFTSYLDRIIPQNIDMQIDNKSEPNYKYPPRIVDGIPYISFRYIFQLFDYNVKPEITTQGSIRAIAKKDTKTIIVEDNKEYAIVNNSPIPLGAAVFMSGNTTYVPIDIIKQTLNMDYNWDKDKKILKITTGK